MAMHMKGKFILNKNNIGNFFYTLNKYHIEIY